MQVIPVKVSSSNSTVPVRIYSSDVYSKVNVKTLINVETVEGETYTGEYIVTPKVEKETRLLTKGLFMSDDVRVLEIPYYETINESDGYTVYIGNEDELIVGP